MSDPDITLRRPLTVLDRIGDGTIAVFAAWTIAFHIVLLTRLSRTFAVVLFVIFVAALAALRIRMRRASVAIGLERETTRPDSWAVPVIALAGVLAASAAFYGHSKIFWGLATITVIAGIAWAARARPVPATVRTGPRLEIAIVVALAVAFGIVTLVVRSPAGDNAYLLNRALHAQLNGGAFPLRDTMFGNQVFPTVAPADTIASLEPLIGVTAWISHIDVRTLFFLVFATIGAVLGIFALWRLTRTASANLPIVATVVATGFLLLQSQPSSWGPLAVRRPFWGKTMLLAVVLPFLWHHATEYTRTGSRRSLLWMAAGGVAAVGVSSSGTFLSCIVVAAPLAALVIAPPADMVRGAALRRAVIGATGLVYPVVAGAGGSFALSHTGVSYPFRNTSSLSVWSQGIGKGTELWIVTVALLAGWLVVRSRRTGLAFGFGTLGVLALLSPPGLAVVNKLGAGSVGSRFLWALPGPLLIGLIADAPLALRRRTLGALAAIGFIAVIVVASARGDRLLVGGRADATIGRPSWDLDPPAVAAARRLIAKADGSGIVAAPEAVSIVLPDLSTRVFAVSPRKGYTNNLAPAAGPRFRGPERKLIMRVLDGTGVADRSAFVRALRHLHVKVVCVPNTGADALAVVLEGAGYHAAGHVGAYAFWRR